MVSRNTMLSKRPACRDSRRLLFRSLSKHVHGSQSIISAYFVRALRCEIVKQADNYLMLGRPLGMNGRHRAGEVSAIFA